MGKKTKSGNEHSLEKEDLLKLLEKSDDMFYKQNIITAKFEYFSPNVKEVMGYELDELYLLSLDEQKTMFHPDDFPSVKNFKSDLIESDDRGEKYIERIFRLKDKKGNYHNIRGKYSLLRDENNIPTYVIGSLKDITARKFAEDTLKQAKKTYEDIFNSLTEAIYIQDENGVFIDVNKGAEKMYGCEREWLIGKTPLDVAAPGMTDLKVTQKLSLDVMKTGIPSRFDFWAVRKNGEIFPKEVIVNKGKYFGKDVLIATARDMTKQKEAEEKLKISEERYRLLVENQRDLLVKTNLEGELLYVNPPYCNLFEKTQEELLGKSFSPLIHPDDLAVVEKAIECLNKEPYLCTYEERAKTIHGWRWISWTAKAVLDEAGNIVAYVGAGRDITEMKDLMDELLKAKIKAEESDKLKSAFLANMSHEIRTPMNGIIGFLDLLREPDLSDESKNKYIDLVNRGGERLLNTINDIIEISKIESGQMKVQFSRVNIRDVMEYHYHFFEHQVNKQNVEFRIGKKISGNGEIIKTDKNKLEGILTNLLRNAIKFTKEGFIEFGNYIEDGELIFYVSDTGIGISKEKLEKIFERFVQGDVSFYERPYEGSGLGLSIVKAYSELIKGKVWVESDKGKGSTFYFSIPYLPENQNDNIPQKNILADSYEGMDIKILIAEDDLTSYLLMSTLLSKKGIEVIKVNNGKEALEILSGRNDISLVLMDLKMPVMDGIKATKAIREFNKDIPIIAVTAYALSGDKEMALEAGCNDYISKPLNTSLLFSKLKNHLKIRNIF